MDVNSATATSIGALVNSPQPQPAAPKSDQRDKQTKEQQDSAVVKLSAQAQQLHRAENQNNNVERQVVTKSKEAAEPPGIRLMEARTKGGHVNTYA